MRQKLNMSSAARIDARCPVDTGNRVAGQRGQAYARRRPRSIAGLSGQRRRKSRFEPLIRRRALEAGPDVIDDFPTTIPVTPRELDVIETYLGAFLDDALGKRE